MNEASGRSDRANANEGKSYALVISIGLLLLQAVCALALSIWESAEHDRDTVAVNLSGRQRMLTQRLTKALLEMSYAKQVQTDNLDKRKELLLSYTQFDQTLSALSRGAIVDRNGQFLALTTTQDQTTKDLIRRADVLWAPMRTALLPLLSDDGSYSSKELERAVEIFMRDNQNMLVLMNDLTNAIEDAARIKSGRLRTAEGFLIALMLINFAFSMLYIKRHITLLAESKSLLRRIMESVGAAIFVLNERGEIVLSNPAANALFGYEWGELVGRDVRELIDTPYFQMIGKHASGERFSLDIDLGEISSGGRRLFVASLVDLTAQKIREEKLSYLAYHDSLTGLPNRLLFMDRLVQAIAHAHRNLEQVAVLFIDLDQFKQINDMLGHAVGDALLQGVATRLVACMREGDTVARLAGDEFTMIIEGGDEERGKVVAQKILAELGQAFNLNGEMLRIAASIGLALYPLHGNTVEALLQHADEAMYEAKAMGGNTCYAYAEAE